MTRYSTLSDLCHAIGRDAASSINSMTADVRAGITKRIISEWTDGETDRTIFAEPSEIGEFAWRAMYLQDAVIGLHEMSNWVSALPFRKLDVSVSRQLQFLWWAYFMKVGEFQDRSYKLFISAGHFADGPEAKAALALTKKQFVASHLKPLDRLVRIRNAWVHDASPELSQLKRLSSLELFQFAYGIEPDTAELAMHLKVLAKNVSNSERQRLLDVLKANDEKFVLLADQLVQFIIARIALPRFG